MIWEPWVYNDWLRKAKTEIPDNMQLRVGYELIYNLPQPTPIILTLNIHYSREADIVIPDCLTTGPSVPVRDIATALGTGATGLWHPPGISVCRPMRSSTIPANRITMS